MKRLAYFLLSFSVLIVVAVIAAGDYVYREGTKLSCSENITAKNNTPKEFYPNEKDRGPFRGDGWDKWVTTDLSDWWITETNYEKTESILGGDWNGSRADWSGVMWRSVV